MLVRLFFLFREKLYLPQMISSVHRVMNGKMSNGWLTVSLSFSTSTALCSLNTRINSSRILKWKVGVSILRRWCHLLPVNVPVYLENYTREKITNYNWHVLYLCSSKARCPTKAEWNYILGFYRWFYYCLTPPCQNLKWDVKKKKKTYGSRDVDVTKYLCAFSATDREHGQWPYPEPCDRILIPCFVQLQKEWHNFLGKDGNKI